MVVATKVDPQPTAGVDPARVQTVKDPVTPVSLKATVPVGARVPVESTTVTLQLDPVFTTTGVLHEIIVLVGIGLTTILAVPLLEE